MAGASAVGNPGVVANDPSTGQSQHRRLRANDPDGKPPLVEKLYADPPDPDVIIVG